MKKAIPLKDSYNTIIFCYTGDNIKEIRDAYKERLADYEPRGKTKQEKFNRGVSKKARRKHNFK